MKTGDKYDRISCSDDAHASWWNDNFNFYNNERKGKQMKYYVATVKQTIEVPAGKKTRTKTLKEEILVGESTSVSVVEKKINELMSTNPNEWELVSVRESRIVEVV